MVVVLGSILVVVVATAVAIVLEFGSSGSSVSGSGNGRSVNSAMSADSSVRVVVALLPLLLLPLT